MTDQTWNGLIKIAVKYQNRLGKFHNVRYDRLVVFTVKNICELASILVEEGMIEQWPGGHRRLRSIEDRVMADFKKLHKKYHIDP